jgi:hypothetical protein
LAEVCDIAYLVQVEQIERHALAAMTTAPYAEEPIPSAEELIEKFDEALMAVPVPTVRGGMDELKELITVGGGGQ